MTRRIVYDLALDLLPKWLGKFSHGGTEEKIPGLGVCHYWTGKFWNGQPVIRWHRANVVIRLQVYWSKTKLAPGRISMRCGNRHCVRFEHMRGASNHEPKLVVVSKPPRSFYFAARKKCKTEGECWTWTGPVDSRGCSIFRDKLVRGELWLQKYKMERCPPLVSLCENDQCVFPFHHQPREGHSEYPCILETLIKDQHLDEWKALLDKSDRYDECLVWNGEYFYVPVFKINRVAFPSELLSWAIENERWPGEKLVQVCGTRYCVQSGHWMEESLAPEDLPKPQTKRKEKPNPKVSSPREYILNEKGEVNAFDGGLYVPSSNSLTVVKPEPVVDDERNRDGETRKERALDDGPRSADPGKVESGSDEEGALPGEVGELRKDREVSF